jgi:hypothetical protein
MNKLRCFSGRDPTGFKPLFFNTTEFEHFLENGHTLLGGIITIQVIAFSEVSATYENTIHPLLESKKYMMR